MEQKYESYFDDLLYNMIEGVAIHKMVFDKNNKPIDYIILKINKGYTNILGYTTEVEGKLASELYGDVPALEEYSDVVMNKKSKKFDFYYPTMNKYFSVSTAPWNDIGFISIFSDITDRIITQQKLEESNNFNKNLINSIPYKMEVVSSDGTILFINELMKYTEGDIVGKKCWDVHSNNTTECYKCPINNKIVIGKTNEVVSIHNNKIYRKSLTGIKFKSKLSLLEIFQDITSESKFEYLMEIANVIILTLDSNGNITSFNKFSEKLTGYKKEEVLGKNWFDIFILKQDNKMPKVFSDILDGLSEVSSHENNILCKNGSVKMISWENTTLKYSDEDSFGVLSIGTDITESKRVSESLERAELISQTGNWELHLNTNMIFASNGAKKIYGIEKTNKNKMSFKDVQKIPLKEYRKILDDSLFDLIENDIPYDVEFKIKILSVIKNIRSIAFYDKKNKIVFGVIQDITKQKKNEEELEKSNAIKSVFLSNVSHELKTPMNSIIGFSDILLEREKKKNEKYRFLRAINSNAKHLDELLNNILDYSKLESADFDILYEKFYINDLFDDLYNMFNDVNNRKNLNLVKLDFIKNDNNKKIVSDYLRLKQVLFNVISNSIKFTEKGYIKMLYTIVGEFIIFEIEDTGIGISKNKIKYVFDRFWQGDSTSRKKYKGTGLGLSISKSIIGLLSGDIWVKSIYNKGSTFYIKIPLEETKKEKIPHIKTKIDYSNKMVLVVDEIPVNHSLLGMYINSFNIKMVTSNNSIDAINKYKQNDKIDIIFIDLPDSIDLINKLKKINKDCIIISKSGLDSKNELVNYHLKKPIDKNELLLILNKIWLK